MFERFVAGFQPDPGREAQAYDSRHLAEIEGFAELVSLGAGVSFGNGIVRIHTEHEAERADKLIRDIFPLGKGIVPIAADWQGRQYAAWVTAGTPMLLFDPGSAAAYEVDCTIPELFDGEMVRNPDTYLAADLFRQWKAANPDTVPPGRIVGFKRPLFLGGAEDVDNLEVIDEEVYWSIHGQLWAQVKDLPQGTKISGVTINK